MTERQDIHSDITPSKDEHTPEYLQWKQKQDEQRKKDERYEKQIQTIEKELGSILWRYEPIHEEDGKPREFRACELRDQVMARREYNIVTDKHTQVIYLYTEKTGFYHKDGEQYLQFILDRALAKDVTTRRINETIELLKIRTYATIQHSQKIAVQNGLLDIQTGNIEAFTPYEFNTAKLHVEYKADAKCPKWLAFIEQICPQDKDLLQEWSGYFLRKGMPYHALMWFIGPKGRNGKGTWARTMQAILGEENYSAVPIEYLDGKHRFAVFNLRDSLLNICSEPRADRKLTIELLQALSGEDPIDAERKGIQEPFKMVNPAKMTIMGNKFPNIDNPTDAWWERLKLIKFPNRFVGDAQIPNIERIWLDDPEERSGILNWMIEGALRLIKNRGQFTQTKTQKETIIQFKRASDTVGAFIMECLTLDLKAITPKADPYPLYKEYCEAIGAQPKSANELNEKLESVIGVKATSVRTGAEKKKTKVWKGFILKSIPEMSDDDKIEDDDEDATDSTTQTTLGVESGTRGTNGTTFGTSFESLPQKNPEENDEDNSKIVKKAVPLVPAVPSEELEEPQTPVPTVPENEALLIKTDESGLKRLEVNQEFKASAIEATEIIHFLRLSDSDQDTHKCDKCQALQAKIKMTSNQGSGEPHYGCESCFNEYRFENEPQGVKFIDDTMPDYDREVS